MFTSWKELRILPKNMWILSIATLINRMGTMVIPFLIIYLTLHLKLQPGKAAFVMSVYGMGSLFIAPVSGWLCDRFGSLFVMVFSLMASGSLILLYPLLENYHTIIGLTLAWSLTAELFRPAAFSSIAEFTTAEHRKMAFALNRLAINLGMSVGPVIGGILSRFSFPLIFIVDGVTTLVSGLIVWIAILPEHKKNYKMKSQDERPSFWNASLQSLSDVRLVYLLFAMIPIGLVFFQHESTLALYLVRDRHFEPATFGLIFTVNTALIILTELPLNLRTSHWKHARTLFLGCVFFGLGFGAYAMASSIWLATLATAIWTIGEMLLFPSLAAYISEIAPESRRGSYMGLYSMSFGFAFVIGPLCGTWVLEHLGSNFLWGGCLGVSLISAVLFGRIRN